ncbi:YitT family protein, partial [Xanthomonas perforans]|uniref:YitT family protein n=1 Tax=Xanthomonas perforans TaxID=442694 RepID=UPI001F26C874
GIGILAVYLQRERGWSAGKVQMSFDAMLMLVAFFVLTPDKVLYSAIGALMLRARPVWRQAPSFVSSSRWFRVPGNR